MTKSLSDLLEELTPKRIVEELDKYIVGQAQAKKAVAIALRNRWRRQRLPEHIRDEVAPKNLLMIGPTGVGKTEIARRIAQLIKAPFVKVEATKYTEIGYVGMATAFFAWSCPTIYLSSSSTILFGVNSSSRSERDFVIVYLLPFHSFCF